MISSYDYCETIGMLLLLFAAYSGVVCGIISLHFFVFVMGLIL